MRFLRRWQQARQEQLAKHEKLRELRLHRTNVADIVARRQYDGPIGYKEGWEGIFVADERYLLVLLDNEIEELRRELGLPKAN